MNKKITNIWYTCILVILGLVSLATKEVVTFTMLGFIIIMLSNIYDKLDEISKKKDNH